MKSAVSLLFRVGAHLGNDGNPHLLPPQEAAPRLGDASQTRDLAWEEMLLLGSPEVVEAGRAWAGAVAAMERFVRDGTRDPGAWPAGADASSRLQQGPTRRTCDHGDSIR
ncbi:hypothetical protein [Streptomyces sp. CNQ-509]|uniref:hypothetical protein n=1 Tax=Streptomyces sp. CNQ-509 TaxID=444103 RepID=UPI00119C623C|nr:hypothetical protein [Streptomyces sp. CNQ-509]